MKPTKSSNTGANPPITLPAEPGILVDPRLTAAPEPELAPEPEPAEPEPVLEGDLALLEELWNVPAPLAGPDRRLDPPAYNLRPRHELRAPRKYGQNA